MLDEARNLIRAIMEFDAAKETDSGDALIDASLNLPKFQVL